MPDTGPLSAEEMDALERNPRHPLWDELRNEIIDIDENGNVTSSNRFIATVRDRERQRDQLQEQIDEIILKPLEPLLDAVMDDTELQGALATDNDNMILRAERDELQRQLAEARKAVDQLRKEYARVIGEAVVYRTDLEALRDAISPSRKGMVGPEYYLGVVKKMRERELKIAAREKEPQ